MDAGSNAAQEHLVNFVERIERLTEEKAALGDDIKEVFAEAKGEGYDARTMRSIIQLRKLTKAQRQERRSLLDTYLAAFGMDDEE